MRRVAGLLLIVGITSAVLLYGSRSAGADEAGADTLSLKPECMHYDAATKTYNTYIFGDIVVDIQGTTKPVQIYSGGQYIGTYSGTFRWAASTIGDYPLQARSDGVESEPILIHVR